VGRFGEAIAQRVLEDHGLKVVARNLVVNNGEIDLLALDGDVIVAVEVRTVTAGDDPIDAIGDAKRSRVQRLAPQLGAQRVDFVGIRLDPDSVVFHWVPDGF